jgi:Rho family protein
VLVALKCDLRERSQDDDEETQEPKRPMIEYKQGLQVAQRIKALRYLGMERPFGIAFECLR